jgi:hypothetical protein
MRSQLPSLHTCIILFFLSLVMLLFFYLVILFFFLVNSSLLVLKFYKLLRLLVISFFLSLGSCRINCFLGLLVYDKMGHFYLMELKWSIPVWYWSEKRKSLKPWFWWCHCLSISSHDSCSTLKSGVMFSWELSHIMLNFVSIWILRVLCLLVYRAGIVFSWCLKKCARVDVWVIENTLLQSLDGSLMGWVCILKYTLLHWNQLVCESNGVWIKFILIYLILNYVYRNLDQLEVLSKK